MNNLSLSVTGVNSLENFNPLPRALTRVPLAPAGLHFRQPGHPERSFSMNNYRALSKPKGLFEIQHRAAKHLPFATIGTAISYSGVVSFKSENYHSIKELLRKLEQNTA